MVNLLFFFFYFLFWWKCVFVKKSFFHKTMLLLLFFHISIPRWENVTLVGVTFKVLSFGQENILFGWSFFGYFHWYMRRCSFRSVCLDFKFWQLLVLCILIICLFIWILNTYLTVNFDWIVLKGQVEGCVWKQHFVVEVWKCIVIFCCTWSTRTSNCNDCWRTRPLIWFIFLKRPTA